MARFVLLVLAVTAFSAETPLRILFLGNSYTYYNNLPKLVEGMARRPVEAVAVTRGGATLEGLYIGTNALEVLRSSRWDLVVLQEHSALGLSQFNGDFVVHDPAAFFAWARIWDAEIQAQGARTVFLNTWARKGREEQQAHLDWAYATIARELGAGLIPAGAAFQGVSGIELFQPDGTHPSPAGSYLAACAAVEILTAGGCAGAPAVAGLSPEMAALLQQAALAAVERLRAEQGYWRLARPVHIEETVSGSGLGDCQGRWEGVTWLYGKKAKVMLQVEGRDGACAGTWTVEAREPATHATMALENCTVTPERLRFTVRPLFLTAETHEAWAEGAMLQGTVSIQSMSAYVRQRGTWTLQRVTQ